MEKQVQHPPLVTVDDHVAIIIVVSLLTASWRLLLELPSFMLKAFNPEC